MNQTLIALTGFAGWTLTLSFLLLNMRAYYTFISRHKIALNDFSPDGSNTPGFGQRVTRAQLNCIEMLPAFAALVIVASFSEQLDIMNSTVMYVLYARVGQSITHMISTNMLAVVIRAGFWGVQLALLLFYSYQLLSNALSL
ncbi:MAG: MAPEG family protein [Colwellia sp.]